MTTSLIDNAFNTYYNEKVDSIAASGTNERSDFAIHFKGSMGKEFKNQPFTLQIPLDTLITIYEKGSTAFVHTKINNNWYRMYSFNDDNTTLTEPTFVIECGKKAITHGYNSTIIKNLALETTKGSTQYVYDTDVFDSESTPIVFKVKYPDNIPAKSIETRKMALVIEPTSKRKLWTLFAIPLVLPLDIIGYGICAMLGLDCI